MKINVFFFMLFVSCYLCFLVTFVKCNCNKFHIGWLRHATSVYSLPYGQLTDCKVKKLKSKFSLILVYLNQALNNSAQELWFYAWLNLFISSGQSTLFDKNPAIRVCQLKTNEKTNENLLDIYIYFPELLSNFIMLVPWITFRSASLS